ncbi:MAG: alpha/beta fold hydrolase [Acidimicrobiia bacterium]|nr:alpha/beta fold hydrolase [Acidimicrobiia bacterium]
MPEPFVPEGRILDLPGRGETFVRAHFSGTDRPTLLLLHGWTITADLNWFACYAAFAERYNLVAIDHRGHGRGLRSTHPFDLEAAADDAAAALELLGVRPVVAVGYSMGGPVALHLAGRHPGIVEGLVLTATAARFNRRLDERLEWALLPLLPMVLRRDGLVRALRRALDKQAALDPAVAAWRGRLVGETQRASTASTVEAGRALSRYDAREVAMELELPAAVVLTSRDRAVPPSSQRELAKLLRARVLEIEAGHDVFIQQPAAFAAGLLAGVEGVLARRAEGNGSVTRAVARHARRWRRRHVRA